VIQRSVGWRLSAAGHPLGQVSHLKALQGKIGASQGILGVMSGFYLSRLNFCSF